MGFRKSELAEDTVLRFTMLFESVFLHEAVNLFETSMQTIEVFNHGLCGREI